MFYYYDLDIYDMIGTYVTFQVRVLHEVREESAATQKNQIWTIRILTVQCKLITQSFIHSFCSFSICFMLI